MEPSNLTQLFFEEQVPARVKGKKRVDLLKAIEGITRQIFKEHKGFESLRDVLGAERAATVEKAVLDQLWSGIDEYTEEFYRVLEVAVKRQNLQRAFVRQALDSLDHGFDPLDRALIYHGSLVGDLYEDWYRRFAQTVQGNDTAKRLVADDKAGRVPKDLYNRYTVILFDENSTQYTHVANASFYKHEISAIVAAFDRWIAELQRCDTPLAVEKEQHLVYLSAYRAALAETDPSKLESLWTEVDQKWMDIRHWVQIVHDIEYGYGDPLRCKVTPEFSVRLLDDNFDKENATIQEIQGHMVGYFSGRHGQLAKDGISGLKKSMAGIYYLPFQQGVNLYFRFAGQSIPNRGEVRLSHGCKIYFDPVSTAARESSIRQYAERVCADPGSGAGIDTVATIVYHIAAHEIGHAIYCLDALRDIIKVSTKTLLEEPRAELTALHTMHLLTKKGFIDESQNHSQGEYLLATLQARRNQVLASFMLGDLRRFVVFDSSATKPYLISAMSNWARAERLGYLTLDGNGRVCFDTRKIDAFLADCSAQFEAILDAEDAGDGAAIEAVLEAMQACEGAPIVSRLVDELFHKERRARAGA